jgi:hypothetical protein
MTAMRSRTAVIHWATNTRSRPWPCLGISGRVMNETATRYVLECMQAIFL